MPEASPRQQLEWLAAAYGPDAGYEDVWGRRREVSEAAASKGRVLGIVRARPGATGPITVRVTAEGLAPASVTLQARPANGAIQTYLRP